VLTKETLIFSIHIYRNARDINIEHWIWRNNWIYKHNIIYNGKSKELRVYLPCSLLHTCTPRPRTDISEHLYFAWIIVMFISCIRPLLGIVSIPRTVNLVLCQTPVWLLASTIDAQDKVQTHMIFASEALSVG